MFDLPFKFFKAIVEVRMNDTGDEPEGGKFQTDGHFGGDQGLIGRNPRSA